MMAWLTLPLRAHASIALSGELETRYLPWWLFLIVSIILLAAAVRLYRRDRGLLAGGRGWVLTILRAGAVLVLLGILLDLVWIDRSQVTVPAAVLLVVDTSESMSIRDDRGSGAESRGEATSLEGTDVGGSSRLERVRHALETSWLEELTARHRIALATLDTEARRLGDPEELLTRATEVRRLLSDREASGAGTNLGDALVELATSLPRRDLAGLILFSDGNHHAPGDPRDAARILGRLGLPVIAIGVGAPVPPPDIAVRGVEGVTRVFTGDEVELELQVESWGPGREVPVAIGEEGRSLAEVPAKLAGGGALSRVPISFPAGPPGRRRLTISIPPQPDEATAVNNQMDLWLEVQRKEARILYVDRGARWEQHYLVHAWEREDAIEVQAVLLAPEHETGLPEGFPRDADELFAHDVIVLGDVSPEPFAPPVRKLLTDFVERRGGCLLLIAGEAHMPYSWSGTDLERLLPVTLSPATPPPALAIRAAKDGLQLRLTADGETSPITRLLPGRMRNNDLWGRLPRPRWFCPVSGAREGSADLVTVELDPASLGGLLPASGREESAGGDRVEIPVFAIREQGAGRVFYAGIDSTWRWRRGDGIRFFEKFWDLVMRWALIHRLEARDEHVRLGTDRAVSDGTTPLEIGAYISSPELRPSPRDIAQAVVRIEDIEPSRRLRAEPPLPLRIPLRPVAESGGRYQGTIGEAALQQLISQARRLAPRPRTIECSVRLEIGSSPDYGDGDEVATARFSIDLGRDLEASDLSRDQALLDDLARLSGGKSFPIARRDEAIEALPDRSREELREESVAVWDHPLVLGLCIVFLLATEWILRKRWDLI